MADVFSPAERLERTFRKEGTERPPVICPGGMMNAAIIGVMEKGGHTLPEAHHDGGLMAALAEDVAAYTGFENFGLPFCMTVEPEALGAPVDYGSLRCEPKIERENFARAGDVSFLGKGAVSRSRRGREALAAISLLSRKHPDVPVIGSVSGPVSTAAALVEQFAFFKDLYRDREGSHRLLSYVTDQLVDWALLLAESGASVISIADPTATGEILGPRLFEEYALGYINRIAEAVHGAGKRVIVHICGDVKPVKKHLFSLRGDALSVDAMVNLLDIKKENGDVTTMGNLSTYLLERSSPERINKAAHTLLEKNIDIIAPACGLSTSSPLVNIQSFTAAVKETRLA
ncbi:MAG: methylcobamide--CoM methyltransferase [Spirochaetaceae bacterium]|jgi:[methyl-Co(III) methanol-specific corrinoid protein]:coenzyme M methyltransferase|nr:methylcobamide--CoM methyltransferase [Spirochaetaceae bacterium]